MEKYDTIIVGAGTAGLSAAMELQKYGSDYLLIDKKPEIGKPIRSTGGVSMYFVKHLGMPDNNDVVSSYISSIELSGDNKSYSLEFDHPVGLVYDFTKYEQYMAKGLNIKLNEPAISVSDNILQTANNEYRFNRIVFATGPNSIFQPSWYKIPKNDMIIGYEETRKIKYKSDVDLALYFSRYAEGGYIWDFPDGNLRKIGIGIPVTNNEDPRAQLGKFTRIHNELCGDIDHKISHQIPVGKPSRMVVDGNKAYIGDMIGTCFASTGGGLQGAFWSGQLAAQVIAMDGKLSDYQKLYEKELYPLLLRHYKIKKIMYKIGTSNIEKLFDVMNGFTVKSENATREIPRLLMHIAIKKPSLFPTIMGAMF